VINKALPNAFAGTDLYTVFRGLGCDPLIIAELMPHICIGSTARAALDFGIPCKVVADACATRDLPESNGNVFPTDFAQSPIPLNASNFKGLNTKCGEGG
jgi:nicotinamidase-related amidase